MSSTARNSLIHRGRRWEVPRLPDGSARQLAAELGISPPVARVLALRAQGGDPRTLLENDLGSLSCPFQLRGIERAVERIEQAVERGERIFIHGDFDVDGLTSAALLYRALRRLGAPHLKVEIEDRERGHGLNPEVVQRILVEGHQLLITTDCGISDVECVKTLQESDVDVIITDHHQPPEELPPAYAIVNPRQADCDYANPDLAAVGVVYQTISALFEHVGLGKEAAQEYLDLVMLGTVGDLVPLVRNGTAENRILVKEGLSLLAQGGGSLGLRVLIRKLSLNLQRLTAGELSYIVIPKLNAANRVGDPRVAFLLLTTEDSEKAEYWASILLDYNADRQVAQEDLRAQAEELLEREIDLERDRMIILSGKYWNPGIIGLVASDLVEKYCLPTILISEGDELSRASGRSIPEFNLIESLTHCKHFFERYGGHHMAAGFSIRNERIPELKEELGAYAREALADFEGPTQRIDAELDPEEISLELYEELKRLGPFGVGNREPRFLLRDVRVYEVRTVGNGAKHLKLVVRAGDREFDVIGFGFGDQSRVIERAGRIDLVFKLDRDDWNRLPKVQLELVDVLEPSSP
jgi:single-stranded-DNA-specific exonuclease